MNDDAKGRFDAGAEDWAHYNTRPLGRIRREVTWRNLAPHLPVILDTEHPPRVLDAGGGSGELALRLVQHGYRVWLLDYAPAMLDQAEQTARHLPDNVRARLTCCQVPAEEAPGVFDPQFFDVITCHTLLEYLPRPQDALRGLINLLNYGGLFSVSFVNRHAETLRQVWQKSDPVAALACLEEDSFHASLFDVTGTAYTTELVSAWLGELGLTITEARGVRALADYVPREGLDEPEFFEALLNLEIAVAGRHPYMLLARYVHLIFHKHVESL